MPTSKKSSPRNAVPVKTKESYNVKGKMIPVYHLPAGSIIDPEKFILHNSKKTPKGKSAVLRKEDLVPKMTRVQNLPLFSSFHFGGAVIDTFTPTYGAGHNSNGRFLFEYSRATFTSGGVWMLSVERNDFPIEQKLSVRVSCSGIPNPHLRVVLGQTEDASTTRSILTVSSDANNFKIDVVPLSNKSFHITLDGSSDTVTFTLLRADAGEHTYCSIVALELYDTILVDPGPVLGLTS